MREWQAFSENTKCIGSADGAVDIAMLGTTTLRGLEG